MNIERPTFGEIGDTLMSIMESKNFRRYSHIFANSQSDSNNDKSKSVQGHLSTMSQYYIIDP
jgi:hypothetical protein